MSILSSLTKITTRSKKRLGRGYGSGKGGHTSSRGQKGQKSRVGSKVPLWFEGGALPLSKRIPMWRVKAVSRV
jgi:large subunit ribosomal protein L15